MRGVTLIVIRSGKNKEVLDSKPCFHCCKLINIMGIKKIIYSTNLGTLEKISGKDIKNEHVSLYNKVVAKSSPKKYS